MSARALYLFDDDVARRWEPFSLTRPVGELILGSLTLRARAAAVLGAVARGHLTHPGLQGFQEPDAPPVLERSGAAKAGSPRIYLSSRVALTDSPGLELRAPTRLTVGGRTVGWVLGPEGPPPPEPWLLDPSTEGSGAGPAEFWRDTPDEVALKGELLEAPWSLMAANVRWLLHDGARLWTQDDTPDGVIRTGDHPLSLAPGARVEPGIVVDTREGPVRLEEGAWAVGPARLTGPLHVGPDSAVLGGAVGRSSLGPMCKVRGEVGDSIILGFTNKAHDGHLGHALLGRWVNLGAGTTNSDLKNNYGPVRVATPEGPVDTGLAKVGCFLGDHVKTGIGTLLTTGAVVGAGSNLFGGGLTPASVPPFAWGGGPEGGEYRLAAFLTTAERTMARRDQTLTEGLRRVLSRAWEDTRPRRAP